GLRHRGEAVARAGPAERPRRRRRGGDGTAHAPAELPACAALQDAGRQRALALHPRQDRPMNDAPRVTLAEIEAEIVSEYYFTAAEGVFGADYLASNPPFVPSADTPPTLNLLTFCVLVLRNG